jgi:hypothetical protein
MGSVFLSHSSEDKPLARRIARDLQAAGHYVWLDEWEIHVGHSITQKIQQGLEKTDFVVVLLTRRSVESGWVEKEWQSRIGREIKQRSVEVLPVLANDCEIPLLLRDKKYADIRDYRLGFDELLRALAHHERESEARRSRGSRSRTPGSRAEAMPPPLSAWPGYVEPEIRGPGLRKGLIASAIGLAILTLLTLCQSMTPDVGSTPKSATSVVPTVVRPPASAESKAPPKAASVEEKPPAERTVAPSTESEERVSRVSSITPTPPAVRTLDSFLANGLVTCWPTGCRLMTTELCRTGAKTLRLGPTAAAEDFKYDIACEGEGATDWDAHVCLSPPEEIFAMRPHAKVYGSLEGARGRRTVFQLEVHKIDAHRTFDRDAYWVELVPITEKNKGPVPFAAAQLQGTDLRLQVYLGAGGCINSEQVAKLLYDIDGRGLIEYRGEGSPMSRENENVVSLRHLPKDNEIALAFDRPSGQRVGPFFYRFDAMKAIRARAVGADPPSLQCSRGWQRTGGPVRCEVFNGRHALSWLAVREIQYGAMESILDRKQSVSITDTAFLGSEAETPPFQPVVSFEIPYAWTDVYYRLVLDSGETTSVIRVPLARER